MDLVKLQSTLAKWTYGKILSNPLEAKKEILNLYSRCKNMEQEILIKEKLTEVADILNRGITVKVANIR